LTANEERRVVTRKAAAAEQLSGFGHVPIVPGREVRAESLEQITRDVPLTRGLGRAYGDAALPAPGDDTVAGTRLADRVLSFDADSAVLVAEAGFSLDQLYTVFLPRGYFTPVTPGTRFVTLGGMVASDVHGKNHHVEGCFGRHVVSLRVRVADGTILTCSPTEHPDLFWASVGGMGLTGHILEVAVRLTRVPSPWILQETEQVADIDAFLDGLARAAAAWPMTLGWIDCLSAGDALGRGILYRGRWAESAEAPPGFPRLRRPVPVPLMMPANLLQPIAVRAFNAANFRWHGSRVRRRIVHPASFFYPLDTFGEWYRLYGRRGFTQHQCVLPDSAGPQAVRRFLELVARSGGASFLCVIKDCGAEGEGMLSFPRPGISIALDIPMRPQTQSLIDRLNEFVIAEGGRVYLAKDALTRADHFRTMEPRLDAFLRVRRKWDPAGRIRSAQSVRLFGW
jgi:FAD/FMN-containing dehydrogenase